jgi:soluble lytic murein transglycosylase-like protein
MLLAGTFFVPHAAKIAPRTKASSAPTVASTPAPLVIPPSFDVAMTTTFRLPPSAFEHLITAAAAKYALDAALIRAVINAESAFDPLAVSRAGAMGLMQLMPPLAAEMGVTDPFDPRQNIFAGSRYLRQLLDAYDGDVTLALASYNAGPGAVERYNGVPPYPETQHYVKTITNALEDTD